MPTDALLSAYWYLSKTAILTGKACWKFPGHPFLWYSTTKSNKRNQDGQHRPCPVTENLAVEQRDHKTRSKSMTLSLFDVNSCKMCWESRTTRRIVVHKSLWKITELSSIEIIASLGQRNQRIQLLAGEWKPLLHSPILKKQKKC